MGNQSSQMGGQPIPPHPERTRPQGDEPLEAYMKEQQRDEHLKNLGFKRSKSLRKSISKRLKRKNKRRGSDEPDTGAVPNTKADDGDADDTMEATTIGGSAKRTADVERKPSKDRIPSVERLDRADFPEPTRRQKPIVGNLEPLPTHVQVS